VQESTTRLYLASALALLVSSSSSAAPLVLIVPAEDDAPLRAGFEQAGVAVEAPGLTRELVDAAAGSGVVCAAGDAPCWLRVAKLAGYDTVVVSDATNLVRLGPDGARSIERLQAGPRGTQAAVARLLGRGGAIIVTTTPSGATVTIDGGVVEGGIADGLAPGPHAVQATLDGYAPSSAAIVVEGGAVARESWTLVAASSTVLRWAGLVRSSPARCSAPASASVAGLPAAAICRRSSAKTKASPTPSPSAG